MRQRGSGSGGSEGGLIIVFFIQSEPYIGITPGTERARKGRNEHGRSEGKKVGTKRAEEGGSGKGWSNRA